MFLSNLLRCLRQKVSFHFVVELLSRINILILVSDMETETPSDLIIDNTIEQIFDDNSETIQISCCCMCTETFATYIQLMAHIATTHSIIDQSTSTKDKFSCIFCMRKFKTNRILQCHQNRYQQRAKMEHKFYDCQSCKEKFCVMKDTLQGFLDKQDKTGRHRCVKCIEEKAKEIGIRTVHFRTNPKEI
jgi:hypothetical protein